MGLDMYLRAERYVWYNEDDISEAVAAVFPELPAGTEVKSVSAEIGYWRKANAVHKWFVDHVQAGVDECQKSAVSRDDITRLRDICQRIIDNPDLAPSLLPTQEGFFFGSTEYGEWYLQDIQTTLEICDRALALPDLRWDLFYQSSW